MPSDADIKAQFWKDLGASPFMMLGLDGARDGHTQPMTAKSEGDTGPLWFFTTKDNGLVAALEQSHRAIATYTGKGHDLFASIHGELSVDRDEAVIDRLWDKHVEAWFEHGRADPKLTLLRLDVETAEIWVTGSSIGAFVSRLFGKDPKQTYADNIAEVTL
ncbi:pyridoxamine 5'-phosphate oxidase family protein [Sphingomonas morindae]|uniref:Pyridoxamine 5'-phosphate oxidase family protein n=1 Tax=Sphingomonas morindae TaxID=1541170 RepID=A0ABY4XB64_9SPHN|nr:pyridoxamine 5'-phosphate oxidase family protein [Sphingomonas morindae]USI73986.1 pyridoxamine 5'-phosphate oxidase family protein [Sphingomonas morindae]